MTHSYFTYSLLLFIPLISLYLYFKQRANYWRRRGVQGPKPLPIIGNVWENIFIPQNLLEEQRLLKYGRVYGTLQGWKPVITVAEPQLLKRMLITDFRSFMNHRQYFSGDPLLSKLLSELNDNDWKRMKAILGPTFTASKLKLMQPLIKRCVRNNLKYFEKMADNCSEFDVKLACISYTLDVIANCVFGVDTNTTEDPNNEFVTKAHDLVTFKVSRIISTLLLPSTISAKFDLQLFPKKLVDYFTNVLTDAINQRREMNSQHYKDFVSLLLNAELKENSSEETGKNVKVKDEKKMLSKIELKAQCFMFFFAGFETTASTLHFLIYSLAVNPRIQQTLFEEITQCMQNGQMDDFDSVNSLPYLDAVVNETLRHYTPANVVEHVCTEDYKLGNTGITIEKGTIFSIPIYALHHDPKLFPNPHEFIPERFLSENYQKMEPCSFMPFGCGPRMCIGFRFAYLVMKFFIVEFISSFEAIKSKNMAFPPKYTGKYGFLNCKPLFVAVKKRKNNKIQPNFA